MFSFHKYKLVNYNFLMLICISVLSVTGILIIRSATLTIGGDSTYTKQIVGVGVGMAAMFIVSLIDYHWILKMSRLIYAGTAVVLVLTRWGPFAADGGTGASRWFRLGPVQIQPSEFVKVVMIIVMAQFFSVYGEQINEFKTIVISGIILGIPLMLVLIEPDLSSSLVIVFIFLVIIFTAKISYKWVFSVIGACSPFAAAFVFLVEHDMTPFLEKYQRNRVLSFLHPQDYPDLAMQQTRSIMAIGSGGLYGKGLFNDSLTSVKNGNYLMEQDTDFIFAVAGEELGFTGCCVIIALLFVVVIECLITAARAQDTAGRLIAAGIAGQMAFQSFVNIGVATFLLPNTGLPLPFISAGLSSLLSVFIGAGMILNIGLQRKREMIEA